MQRAPIAYAPLANPTMLAPGPTGAADVNPPFAIWSHRVPHTSASVGSTGAMRFPAGLPVSIFNAAIGDAAEPNDWIAPLWDDSRLSPANGAYVGHQTQGAAPRRTFTVEWRNLSLYVSPSTIVSVQVRFQEDRPGRIEVDYGPVAGSGNFSATMGTEDAAGGGAVLFAPSGCILCTFRDVEALANTRVTVDWGDVGPQLYGEITALPAGALPGSSATVGLRLSNRGTSTATGTVSRLYLSTDDALDASDVEIGAGVADLPFGDTPLDVSVTVPASVPPGEYTLLLEVDADDAWAEADELDNVSGAYPFLIGRNLSIAALRVLDAQVNPGETLRLEIDVSQGPLPFAGPVELEIGASTDLTEDGRDPRLGTVSFTLSGASAETLGTSVTLPDLAPGPYHPFVILDPGDLVPEAVEADNRFVSESTFETGSDLAPTAVLLEDSGAPVNRVDIRTTIGSLAVPFSGAAPYRLWLSEDDTIDPADDLALGAFDVTFAREPSRDDVRSVALPAWLEPGRYRVIVEVDPDGAVTEQDEDNNTRASDPIVSAPDFAIEGVTAAPSRLEIGDPLRVEAVGQNLARPFTGDVAFTVYLSEDSELDPDDRTIHDGRAAFVGAEPGVEIDVSLPIGADSGVPPGDYFVLVHLDPRGAVAEMDEGNNIGRAADPVSLLAPPAPPAPPIAEGSDGCGCRSPRGGPAPGAELTLLVLGLLVGQRTASRRQRS